MLGHSIILLSFIILPAEFIIKLHILNSNNWYCYLRRKNKNCFIENVSFLCPFVRPSSFFFTRKTADYELLSTLPSTWNYKLMP